MEFFILGTLCCNQHNTCGSTRTIDCCRCRIFKNLNVFHVFRCHIAQVSGYSINNDQGVVGRKSRNTTYTYRGSGTWVAAWPCYLHTGHLSLQLWRQLRSVVHTQFLTAQWRRRACQVHFAGTTVADYHNFLQRFGIFLHDNFVWVTIAYRHFGRLITYVSDNKGSFWVAYRQCKISIRIGDNTVSSTFLYNICTDNRPERIFYDTFYGALGLLLAIVCRSSVAREHNVAAFYLIGYFITEQILEHLL